jgi:cell wall-associated NlpC family hydrolase
VRERLAGQGRIAIGAVVVLIVIGAGIALLAGRSETDSVPSATRAAAGGGGGGGEVDLDPAAIAKARAKAGSKGTSSGSGGRPQVVVAVPPGMASEQESLKPSRRSEADRAKQDAQIRKDLAEFRKYLSTIPPASGDHAEVTPQGQAAVPFVAPQAVATVVQAANEIAKTPYRWGGGHGAWRDKGYDCSGSVSFALAAAGLLDGPLTSGGFLQYGQPGRGRWITLWTNSGHIFMEVAGIRYDTSGLRTGSRWQPTMRPTAGFTPRHPPGL